MWGVLLAWFLCDTTRMHGSARASARVVIGPRLPQPSTAEEKATGGGHHIVPPSPGLEANRQTGLARLSQSVITFRIFSPPSEMRSYSSSVMSSW